MKTNIVAPIGGLAILAGGLILAFYTATNGNALIASKAKAVEKYLALSEKALSAQELTKAEKYAKAALAVDPKNKKAIAEFKKIILASCPKVAPAASSSAVQKPSNAQPAAPQAEPEEEMGCI